MFIDSYRKEVNLTLHLTFQCKSCMYISDVHYFTLFSLNCLKICFSVLYMLITGHTQSERWNGHNLVIHSKQNIISEVAHEGKS